MDLSPYLDLAQLQRPSTVPHINILSLSYTNWRPGGLFNYLEMWPSTEKQSLAAQATLHTDSNV